MFKKIGSIFIIIGMLTTYAFSATFTSPTTKVYSGATDVTIPVTLDTEGDSVASFNSTIQFDVTKLVFKGASTALPNKSLEYNEIAPGQIKFVVFGLNADSLQNGNVFSVIFDVIGTGSVTAQFVDTMASDTNADSATITIDPIVFDVVLKGDIDKDGFVNTQDIMLLVRHIIGLGTVALEDGDIDGSGAIDVNDLQALINIVLE